MAEQVHLHLESKLPELEDLLRKGIYEEHELSSIMKYRTKYEYRLKRRGAILEDFLAYIELEKKFEEERKERINSRSSLKGRHSISDSSIIQNIYGLYSRALLKFKGSISLWLQFLTFALSQGSNQVVSKVVIKAIKFHPHSWELWSFAALKWEWGTNGNIDSARALFQRSLRMNRDSCQIWLNFFRLELDFASKLRERRRVLLLEDKGYGSTSDSNDSIIEGAMAFLILSHALKAIPKMTLDQMSSFLKVGDEFSSDINVKIIIEKFKAHFKDSEKHLHVLLTREDSSPIEEVFLENPTSSILFSFISSINGGGSAEKIIALIKENESLINEDIILLCFSNEGIVKDDDDELVTMLKSCAKRINSKEVNSAFIRRDISKTSNVEEIYRIINSSILGKKEESSELVELAFQKWSSLSGGEEELLTKIVFNPLFKISYISYVILILKGKKGEGEMRSFIQSITKNRVVDIPFYENWISIEEENKKNDESFIRGLFSKALVLSGSQNYPSLWRRYIKFEKNLGNFTDAARIHSQAAHIIPGFI